MWASASVNSRGAAAARRRQAQQRRAGGTARQGGSASPARSSQPLATLVATHTRLGQPPPVTLAWCQVNTLEGPSVAPCASLITGEQSCHLSSARFGDDQEMGQTQA